MIFLEDRVAYWTPRIKDRLNKIEWICLRDYRQSGGDIPVFERLEGSVGIRLDFEMTSEELELQEEDLITEENIALVVFEAMKPKTVSALAPDIADLIYDGDVDSYDPLLKNLNGEKKRGLYFSDIYLPRVKYQIEFKPMKDSFELTAWTLLKGIE